MEGNKTLFIVNKSEAEKVNIIIDNVLTMLSNRIFIDKSGDKRPLIILDNNSKKISDMGDNTFVIKANNGDNFAVKIIFQKITSTGKQSVVSDFLKEYTQHKKIIIAEDYNKKISDYMIKNHTQIFKESSLLSDLLSYRDQPKFEVLSPTEIDQFKLEYNATDYTTKKLLRTDPITKYFALKKGDYVRIIRPSPTSGESIDYRTVI